MYPMLMGGVKLEVTQRRRSWQIKYVATNGKGQSFEMPESLFEQLKTADGTHPLHVSPPILRKLRRIAL